MISFPRDGPAAARRSMLLQGGPSGWSSASFPAFLDFFLVLLDFLPGSEILQWPLSSSNGHKPVSTVQHSGSDVPMIIRVSAQWLFRVKPGYQVLSGSKYGNFLQLPVCRKHCKIDHVPLRVPCTGRLGSLERGAVDVISP
jgi:hypothetical protein